MAAKALEVAGTSNEKSVTDKTTGNITTTYTKGSLKCTEVYDKNGSIVSHSAKQYASKADAVNDKKMPLTL